MSDILIEDIEGPPGLCHTGLAPGQGASGEVSEGHGPGERAVELVDVSSGLAHGVLDAAGEAVGAEAESLVAGLQLLGDDPEHGERARLHLPGETRLSHGLGDRGLLRPPPGPTSAWQAVRTWFPLGWVRLQSTHS